MGLFRGDRTWAPVLAAVFLASSPALAEKTVWLVRPLYPGQEALVGKTEAALARILPPAQRQDEIIGVKELTRLMALAKYDELPCLSGEQRCLDPIDAFVARLGADRVVLVQGGQDETGFQYKVTSYRPGKGDAQVASASNALLERAFLGAVVKVVPLASTLDVVSTPPGAAVYIDEQKVGTTPMSTQVLPGERALRIDLKLHQPVEELLQVQARGALKVERSLEKVAARIRVTAQPAGTSITIDGTVAGKDRIDRGIAPGRHTVRLSLEGFKAYEETIDVKPDDQYTLDKTLEAVPGAVPGDKPTQVLVVEKPVEQPKVVVVPPPPAQPKPEPPAEAPLTWTEQVAKRGTYFTLGFDFTNLLPSGYASPDPTVASGRPSLVGRRWSDQAGRALARTMFQEYGKTSYIGADGEFGIAGKYFGVAVLGLSVNFATDPVGFYAGGTLGDQTFEVDSNGVPGQNRFLANVQLYTVRGIQPQFRIALWRFLITLQAGIEFRVGRVLDTLIPEFYRDGFVVLDLLLGLRGGFRFYLADGFFLGAQFKGLILLTGEAAVLPGSTEVVRSSHAIGFTGGFGYAF